MDAKVIAILDLPNEEISENPYPGLRSFEYTENHLFFGREGQAEEIAERLQRNRFVAVVGASGSGKSSLVRAGLLPLLCGGIFYDWSTNWRIAVMRPEETPIHNLAEALAYPVELEPFAETFATSAQRHKDPTRIGIIEATLRRSGVGLLDFINNPTNNFDDDENLLIVVDQFEELFRFRGKTALEVSDEAAAFVKLLLEGVHSKETRIHVVITMRSDFLGDCAQFRNLPETINEGQYLIPRLTREQLRQAIESPAEVYDAEVSSALINRLLNDLEADQNQSLDLRERMLRDRLPVLQHALMRIWEIWKKENNPDASLDLRHYENPKIVGLTKALSIHADEAFNELSDEQKAIAEKMFKSLTETDIENRETRRPARVREIASIAGVEPEVIFPIIETFRRPGRTFLMPPPDIDLSEETKIDISHESLIRNWELLKKWVKKEAEDTWQYRRLTEDALLYEEFNRDETSLLRGRALTDATQWFEQFAPSLDWAERYYVFTDEEKLRLAEIRRINPLAEDDERREIVRCRLAEIRIFLAESKLVEERELAAERRNIRILRIWTTAFATMFLVATVSAFVAYKFYQDAASSRDELKRQLNINEDALNKNVEMNRMLVGEQEIKQGYISRLEKTGNDLEVALSETEESKKQLASALETQKQLTFEADEAKEIAENNAERLRIAEAKTQQTLGSLRVAFEDLDKASKEAIKNAEREKAIAERGKTNLKALTSLEVGSYKDAIDNFTILRDKYAEIEKRLEELERRSSAGDNAARDELSKIDRAEITQGIWWANHNLGTSYWKNGQSSEAKAAYLEALKKLDEQIILPNPDISRYRDQTTFRFERASFRQTERDAIFRKLATYQRFGQYFHDLAKKAKDPEQAKRLNENAETIYKSLLSLAGERYKDRITYEAEIKIELADIQADLNKYSDAAEGYERARQIYQSERKQSYEIEMLKKISQMELRQNNFEKAATPINSILAMREKELSPDDPEIADIYQYLADIYSQYQVQISNRDHDPKNPQDKKSPVPNPTTEKLQQTDEEKRVERLAGIYVQIVTSIREINTPKNNITRKDEIFIDQYWFEPYENLALLYIGLGKCLRTQLLLEKSILKAESLFTAGKLSDVDYFHTLKETGSIYRKIKKDNLAEPLYEKLINLSEAKTTFDSFDDINIADFLVKRQKYDLAIKFLERGLKFEKLEPEVDPSGVSILVSIIHSTIADVFEMQGNRNKALEEYQKALDYFEAQTLDKTSKEFAKADIKVRQANFYFNKVGDKDKAQNIYREAKEILDETEYEKIPSRNYVYSLIKIGDIERDKQKFDEAAKNYNLAKNVMESYKALPNSASKVGTYFLPSKNPSIAYYEDYLYILNVLKQLGKSNDSKLMDKIAKTEADLKAAKQVRDQAVQNLDSKCSESRF